VFLFSPDSGLTTPLPHRLDQLSTLPHSHR
jgi:hypothetical protein